MDGTKRGVCGRYCMNGIVSCTYVVEVVVYLPLLTATKYDSHPHPYPNPAKKGGEPFYYTTLSLELGSTISMP